MKRIRKENEDLEEMLRELKVGDSPIFDNATACEIVKVPSGFIYTKEYIGMVFVPDFPKENPKVADIPNSVAKVAPKKAVIK